MTAWKIVTGVDPGGTTGLVTVVFRPVTGYYIPNAESGMMMGAHEIKQDAAATTALIMAAVDWKGPDMIAVEKFVNGRRSARLGSSGASLKAREIVGAVSVAARERHIRVARRSASQVNAWATDKRLKAAGLWADTALTGNHHDARSAARHALMCLVVDLHCPDPLSSAYRPERG